MPRDCRGYLEDILGPGRRDILIHEYFGVDVDILWDVINNKLAAVEGTVTALLRE